jgi:uncharacterized protein YfcZ (UPF0381/DUF406 family)
MNREELEDLIMDYSDAYADSVADLSMYTTRARAAETYKELMDYLDEMDSENTALQARIAEMGRALDIDVDLTIAGSRAELSDALTRIAELEAERKRLFEDKSRLMDCYFEFETIAPDGELKISVLDLYNELTDTRARAERAEAMVTRLIEAGNILADGLDTYWQECYPQALGFWNSLVTEWKERQ